jgi:hypothetical protein
MKVEGEGEGEGEREREREREMIKKNKKMTKVCYNELSR